MVFTWKEIRQSYLLLKVSVQVNDVAWCDWRIITLIDVPPNWLRRAAVLCVFGIVVAAILTLLQTQRSGLEQDYFAIVLVFLVWMLAAALIGSIYPIADKRVYGKVYDFKQDWSNAIRSVAILVGIHQASTVQLLSSWPLIIHLLQKIPFSNVYELVGTLMFLALGLWWMSDRSWCGFVLALLFSLIGAIIGAAAKYLGYASVQ